MKAAIYLVIISLTSSIVFADDGCGGCGGKKKKEGEEKPKYAPEVQVGDLR